MDKARHGEVVFVRGSTFDMAVDMCLAGIGETKRRG
jgi:hypothetical protein